MKILVLTRRDILPQEGLPGVYPGTDSALLRTGEPLFFDGDSAAWRCVVAPAYRIGRLGLNIPLKAAAAHFDGVSLVHTLMPAGSLYPAWAVADRTFSAGEWLDPTGVHDSFGAAIHKIDATDTEEIIAPFVHPAEAAAALSALSAHITFKTGDILVFAYAGTDLHTPLINNYICGTIDTRQVLRFKIK